MIKMACSSLPLPARYFDSLINAFLDNHEEWRPSRDVSRQYDRRQHDYVWTFRASAVNALHGYVEVSAAMSADEREHCARTLQWCAEHGISPPVSAPTVRVKVPDVLPGQLGLFT